MLLIKFYLTKFVAGVIMIGDETCAARFNINSYADFML